MPLKRKIRLKTLRLKYVSLSIRIVLFFLLVAEGIESNPGPGSRDSRGSRGSNSRGRGAEGGFSRGRGAEGPSRGRGAGGQYSPRGRGRGGRGGRNWDPQVDLFANCETGAPVGRGNRGNIPYNLRPTSRSSDRQPSVSEWLMSSQQPQPQEPPPSSNASTQSDVDSASQATELNLDQNTDGTTITSILLEIRRDVKKTNKRFYHIEKSVKSLKRDTKFLKEQNSNLTRQVMSLQTTVAHLETRAQEAESKNERLEAQSRRDNLRFYGFEDKRGETWEESENVIRSYISNELDLEESNIQIERAHRIPSKSSPRPIIVKFSFYKDREKILKTYREKRKQENEQQQAQVSNDDINTDNSRKFRVSEDFPQRVIKARSDLYPFLRTCINQDMDAFLRYDQLIVDGQKYEYDKVLKRPVPVRK